VSVVEVLLEAGADKDARAADGSSALDLAAAYPSVVELLRKATER
jgi:ankyrin repeat protein